MGMKGTSAVFAILKMETWREFKISINCERIRTRFPILCKNWCGGIHL